MSCGVWGIGIFCNLNFVKSLSNCVICWTFFLYVYILPSFAQNLPLCLVMQQISSYKNKPRSNQDKPHKLISNFARFKPVLTVEINNTHHLGVAKSSQFKVDITYNQEQLWNKEMWSTKVQKTVCMTLRVLLACQIKILNLIDKC